MEFAGKTVLVTGASRGIGRAIACAFAAQGARVVVHHGTNRDAALATLDMLQGDGHLLAACDLASATAVREMVDGVLGDVERLDILVNNAGVYVQHAVLGGTYAAWLDAWRQVLDINLLGAVNVTWCVAQHMVANGGGRIVNVSSRGAFRGEPNALAYGASKAALNSFGQSLAQALGPHGVSVATVAPGYVQTDMVEEILAGPQGDGIRAQSPLGRVARPEDVAHAVLFLACEGAGFCTGAILDVNGASYLRT